MARRKRLYVLSTARAIGRKTWTQAFVIIVLFWQRRWNSESILPVPGVWLQWMRGIQQRQTLRETEATSWDRLRRFEAGAPHRDGACLNGLPQARLIGLTG